MLMLHCICMGFVMCEVGREKRERGLLWSGLSFLWEGCWGGFGLCGLVVGGCFWLLAALRGCQEVKPPKLAVSR